METISPPLPKKPHRGGNGVAGKTAYDDVFAARPKLKVPTLSPRDEDYSEIFEVFHASRGSSIPVLNLPAVEDEEDSDVFVDVRSSGFDYSEVFGSSNGFDFAVSYEQLFKQSKANHNDDSSNEAWTPAQSESLSDESDPFGCSEKNQSLSSEDIRHSNDDTKQFNISYHKANPKGKDDVLDGLTRVTQLDAIPGYSFIINDTAPSHHVEIESSPLQIERNTDCGGVVNEGKRLRKTVSQPAVSDIGLQGKKTEANLLTHNDKSRSSGKAFVSVSDVSLRTQPSHLPPPSRPPPLFTDRVVNSSRLNSKYRASKSYVFEKKDADYSQPYFDVEIDASSSAAASAAAMKDAVERAQEQLSNAKEMMERKKDGRENRMKSHLEKDISHKGERNIKFDKLKSSKGDKFSRKYERESSEMKAYAVEDKKMGRNTVHVGSTATEGKDEKCSEQGGESTQSRLPDKTKGTVAWKEATQFYEVVEEKNISEAYTIADQLVSSDCGADNTGTAAVVELQEYDMQTKAATVDRECQEIGEKFEVFEGGHEQLKKMAAQGSVWPEEHKKKSKLAQMGYNWQDMDKNARVTLQPGETDDEVSVVDKFENDDIPEEDQLKESEVIFKQKLKGANERVDYAIRIKEAPEGKDSVMERKASFDSNEYIINFSADVKQEKDGGKLNEALKLSAELDKEACERQVNDSKHAKNCEIGQYKEKWDAVAEPEGGKSQLKEISELKESNNRLGVDLKQQESNKEQNSFCEAENNKKSSKMTIEQRQNTEKRMGASEKVASEERPNDVIEPDENEKRLKEAWEKKEKWKRSREARESEKRVELLFKEEAILNKSSEANVWIHEEGKCEGFNEQDSVQEQLKGVVSDKKLNSDQGNYTTTEELKTYDGGNWKAHEPSVCGETKTLKIEHKTREREVKVKNEPQEANSNSYDMDKNGLQYKGINDKHKGEPLCQTGIVDAYDEDDIDLIGINIKKNTGTFEMATDSENANNLSDTQKEGRKNLKGIQSAFNQEENKDKFTASQVVQESVENERKPGNTLPPQKFTSQNPDVDETSFRRKTILEDREKKERLKKERDLENDFLRKMEEEKEREREREKDRMGVDTATREACERAVADTRERAERAAVERATAEVRQRALAEARERLEKASAEARERLIADKASDARLRAERAAVERATAEARERAIGKAKAEKASYEARDRVERPVTDKFSAYSRNGGFRQSSSFSDLQNLQHQSMGPSRDLKHSHSSVSGGLEGESAQRCKARLERYQRTAERAAKALAEKNMRDLIAQKEQTERNRLAESLDADVKRWSSGKEGNLRALLSTLQYILGPNSGWQPIPLTDVITAAAVKKAYRKATLCVHPDKLQQRGASIHQKYICEKVFDLLKEAWNKFNSEER